MISQIDIEKTLQLQPNKECLFVSVATVLNHVVDTVNNQQIQLNNHECRLLDLQNQISEHDQEIDDCAAIISKMENVEPAENVQPDYVTTTRCQQGM
jgi:hypothetical protein